MRLAPRYRRRSKRRSDVTVTFINDSPVYAARPGAGSLFTLKVGALFFQGDRVGLILRRKFIQQANKFSSGGGDAYFAFTDNLFGAEVAAVEFLVGAAVGAERGAFERNAGKQSTGAGIGEDFRAHHDVRVGGGGAPFGAGSG